MLKNNSTAILVFIRTAEDEVLSKRLLSQNKTRNKAFWEFLNNRVISTARSTQFPVFIIDSSLQKGANFGERYHHAFDQVFKLGFKRIISVGNDTPNLTKHHIESLAEQLNSADLAYGKTQKGIFSLGLTRKTFEQLPFSKIHWQKNTLCASIDHNAKAAKLRVSVLQKELIELNTFHDLCKYRSNEKESGGKSFLSLFFEKSRNLITECETLTIQNSRSRILFRGPPM